MFGRKLHTGESGKIVNDLAEIAPVLALKSPNFEEIPPENRRKNVVSAPAPAPACRNSGAPKRAETGNFRAPKSGATSLRCACLPHVEQPLAAHIISLGLRRDMYVD